jgi:hypothetical protein
MIAAVCLAISPFSSAVEACISCEYVPQVVNTPSKSFQGKRFEKKRHRVRRKSKRARSAPETKPASARAAKPAAKDEATREEATAESENSSISAAARADEKTPEVAKYEADRETAAAESENSSISAAERGDETTSQAASSKHQETSPPPAAPPERDGAPLAEPVAHAFADCSSAHGDLDGRIRACTAIIDNGGSDEKLGEAYTNRADAYRRKGDEDKALADYEKVFELQ